MMEQFATVDECQYEVEFLRGLEGEFEGDDEGAVDLGQDGPFGQSVSDFGARDDVGFADGL